MENSTISKIPLKGDIGALIESYRERQSDLLDLSKTEIERIKKRLKRELNDWEEGTSTLQDNLKLWDDLIENVIPETDEPFEGASNIHVPVIMIFIKIRHSMTRRSILGIDKTWVMESDDDEFNESGVLEEVEEAINYNARVKWNVRQSMSDVLWTTPKDGTGVLFFDYHIETEMKEDFIVATNVQDFIKEFPNPIDSGIKPKEWMELADHVAMNASEETPVHIPIEYEDIKYWGPKARLVNRADFVMCPPTALTLEREDCRGYGYRFMARRGWIKEQAKNGSFYKEAVSKLLARGSTGSDANPYQQNRERNIGLSRSGKSGEFELFNLVYWYNLDDDTETKLVFTYCKDKDVLLCAKKYTYCVDNVAIFRETRRPNSFDGYSVAGELVDTSDEIDAQHNQRINSRKIAEVPTFKGKKGMKKEFDELGSSSTFKPGRVFWLSDPEMFVQFTVQPVDLGTSMQEEQNSLRIASLVVGVDPFVSSGNASSSDPNAPGNKTAMLINQANMRMDDAIAELREGVEKVGEICLGMEYQFGPPILKYKAGDGQTKYVSKKYLRGLKPNMHAVTVTLNPEAEFARWVGYIQFMMQEPTFAQNAKRRIMGMRKALTSGRVQGFDRVFPTIEEAEQEQVEMQARAIVLASKMKQAQAGQEAVMQAQQQKQIANERSKAMIDAINNKSKENKAIADLGMALAGGNGNGKA